jgi:hypothetical protein
VSTGYYHRDLVAWKEKCRLFHPEQLLKWTWILMVNPMSIRINAGNEKHKKLSRANQPAAASACKKLMLCPPWHFRC